jgi:hypothetical protein
MPACHSLNEEQVSRFVDQMIANPGALCHLLPASGPGKQQVRKDVNLFVVDKDMPFNLAYKKKRGSYYKFIPVIPTGERGDEILSSALVEWRNNVDNEIGDDEKQAHLYIQKNYYVFLSTTRAVELFRTLIR